MAHRTVFIEHEKMKGKVDLKIADLVLNLWKLKLDVIDSSQGSKKEFVMLEFPMVGMMEEFLDLVAEYDEAYGSVYEGISQLTDHPSLNWQYIPTIMDYGLDYVRDDNGEIIGEEFSGKHNFIFGGTVKFPQKHLEFVKRKVEEAADGREKEKAEELVRKNGDSEVYKEKTK